MHIETSILFHFRSFDDAIAQLKPVQIKGDPLLQVQLVKVSPDSSYKFLVDFVNLQIMLVDLGIKLKSPQYQSQVYNLI